MNIFCVISSDEQVHEKIASEYADKHHRLIDNVWAVADKHSDSIDVCKRLGIGETFGSRSGVVVKWENYYGHFNGVLWQQVSTWRNSTNG